jgi:predicted RNase H-like nuclease
VVAQESKWRGASGRDRHRLIRAAPSYEHFVHSAPRRDWGERINPNASLTKVLTEAERTTDESVSVIAVDMPVALRPVRARRRCDKSISKAFGGRGCSTHSPTEQRPGVISDSFFQDALEAGFSLRTDYSDKHGGALLEVYPHVALLELKTLRRRRSCHLGPVAPHRRVLQRKRQRRGTPAQRSSVQDA